MVHDRIKVEANVLPRYFNHSSFASLRRQLNYFNFTRIGKGRQRGATYTNEAVIELEDILNLKRKAATDATTSSLPTATNSSSTSKSSAGKALKKRTNCSSSQQKTSNKRLQITRDKTQPATKSTTSTSSNDTVVPTEISPISSFVSSDEERPSATEPRIALDLTISPGPKKHNFSTVPRPMTILHDASCRYPSIEGDGDADILAGCQALLNFAGFGNHHTAESKISSQ